MKTKQTFGSLIYFGQGYVAYGTNAKCRPRGTMSEFGGKRKTYARCEFFAV